MTVLTSPGVSEGIESILERHAGGGRESLIPILQEVQEEYGHLSRENIARIAGHLRVPSSKIYGVATFYNQFRFKPLGQYHIQVCRGTACHVKASAALLDAIQQELRLTPGETSKDGQFSLEVVSCVGGCGLAPVICVNGEFHAAMTPKRVRSLLETLREEGSEV